jgi:hypothetical protein
MHGVGFPPEQPSKSMRRAVQRTIEMRVQQRVLVFGLGCSSSMVASPLLAAACMGSIARTIRGRRCLRRGLQHLTQTPVHCRYLRTPRNIVITHARKHQTGCRSAATGTGFVLLDDSGCDYDASAGIGNHTVTHSPGARASCRS